MITKLIGLKSLCLIACLCFFSSCSYHFGTMSGGSGVVTNGKFSSIDFAYGTAKTTSVLGIGGNAKDALILEAKRNMYQNYDLQPGQVVGQTTVDIKNSIYLFVFVTKVTVSSEIIDFSTDILDSTKIELNLGRFKNLHTKRVSLFKLGEEVVYEKSGMLMNAQIIGIDYDQYVIKYFDHNNHLKTVKVNPSKLKRVKDGVLVETTPSETTSKEILPIDPNNPDKLFTPKNPENKLVRFKHEGKEYLGELLKIDGEVYLIRMQRGSGKLVGLQILEKDIIRL